MSASFVVYIDESGDEGFVFEKDHGGGSSEWFVLSAVVVRQINDHKIIQCLADVRDMLKRPKNFAMHFRKLKHEQRVPYVKKLAGLPIRTVTVLIHKPSLQEPETFKNCRLYHYAVRLLLERVSWLCRDSYKKGEGDGSARIIFSNRSNMSYDDLRGYVGGLLAVNDPLEVHIDPTVITPSKIEAKPHEQWAGLQAADAVASSFYFAAEKKALGFTEPRYVTELKLSVYRHKNHYFGYGLKLWPKECDGMIHKEETLQWLITTFAK